MNIFRSVALAFTVALLQGNVLAQEQLSEVERLRWELVAVRSQLHAALAEREGCRVQLVPMRGAEVRAEITKLKADVESAHDCATKGCAFDVEKGILIFKPRAETEKPK